MTIVLGFKILSDLLTQLSELKEEQKRFNSRDDLEIGRMEGRISQMTAVLEYMGADADEIDLAYRKYGHMA